MKVAIIGSGSWGTALALKAQAAGNDVYLYCRTEEVRQDIINNGINSEFLPGISIPSDIHAESDLNTVMQKADIVLLVTPSQFVRDTAKAIMPWVTKDMIIICCSKGMERNSGKLLTTALQEEIGHITGHIGVLSGPNHAEEVGANYPAATVVAFSELGIAKTVQQALSSETFRVYSHDDIVGVQLAGATKNIIAIAAGIAAELQLGDNLISALLTRGLSEMQRFGIHAGAKSETYYGLAGMGDLIATCMSRHSRNRSAGVKLAQGYTKNDIVNETRMVIEGFVAVEIVRLEAKRANLELPITESLYEVMQGRLSAREALTGLMTRTPKIEFE